MTSLRTGFILAAILVETSVQAQSPQPYGIATFGEFRKMAMQYPASVSNSGPAGVTRVRRDSMGITLRTLRHCSCCFPS